MVPRSADEGLPGAVRAPLRFGTLHDVLDLVRGWLAARTGGLYSVAVDDRGFAVARVLASGRDGIHLRVYSNRYRDRPTRINRSELFLVPPQDLTDAALNATHPDDRPDPGAFAIGHIPLRVASFRAWRPKLIGLERLEADDLVEYRSWQANRRGRRKRGLPASHR
jgi:hypothetical protein